MESKYKLKLIEKHGYEKGSLMYDNWYSKICAARKKQYTLEYWIEKLGPIDGPKKLEEYKKKSAGSKDSFINRYGEEDGLKKYDEFRKSCSIYKMSPESIIKYKNRKNVVSFHYFLEKADGDYIKAALLYKDRQNTSSLDKFILRHGEIEGKEKYEECLIKKLKKFEGKSKFETDFIYELTSGLKFSNMYFDNNKYMFFTNSEFRQLYNKKAIIPDLYIEDINLCIEVYGDWWHLNPSEFDANYYSNFHKKFAYELWKEDGDKLKFLKHQYDVDTIVVWEKEIRNNKKIIIKNLLEKINGLCKTS
jgi:uncharacterized protein YeaO (DUF488 family)